MIIRFLQEKIVVDGLILKPIEYHWSDIEKVNQKDELLKLKKFSSRRPKKHHLIFDKNNEQSDLIDILNTKQKEYNFVLEH